MFAGGTRSWLFWLGIIAVVAVVIVVFMFPDILPEYVEKSLLLLPIRIISRLAEDGRSIIHFMQSVQEDYSE